MKSFWAEILRPGVWTGKGGQTVRFSRADTSGVIATFHKLKDQVRPVLRLGGHPDTQNLNPAVGWVDDMKEGEDGVVLAHFSSVPAVVAEAIETGRYRTVSPGLWGNWEYEGSTYEWVLNHVAILGGSLPAISGLKDLLAYFSSEDAETLVAVGGVPETVISFTESNKEDVVNFEELFKAEQAKVTELTEQNTGLTETNKVLTGANAELTTERDEALTEAKGLKGEIAEFQTAADHAEVTGLVASAVADGRLLPKDTDRMIAMGLSMKSASTNFSSEDEKAKSPFELFTAQLADGGKVVEFNEKAKSGQSDKRTADEKDYEAGAAAAKTA